MLYFDVLSDEDTHVNFSVIICMLDILCIIENRELQLGQASIKA